MEPHPMLTNWKTYCCEDGHTYHASKVQTHTIPITVTAGFFVELGKLILKFTMESKTILEKSNFKTY